MNENRNLKKGVGIHARRLIAYIVLVRFYAGSEQPSVGKLEEFEKWNASGMERYVQQSDRFFAQCSTQRIFFNDDSLCDPCI